MEDFVVRGQVVTTEVPRKGGDATEHAAWSCCSPAAAAGFHALVGWTVEARSVPYIYGGTGTGRFRADACDVSRQGR